MTSPDTTRRLTAILMPDVIGYSRLMQLDQAEALFRDMGMDWWTEQAEGLRGRIDSGKPFKWFAPYEAGPPSVWLMIRRAGTAKPVWSGRRHIHDLVQMPSAH